MKKSLFFVLAVFFGFNTFAQLNAGWEVYHSGYDEELRGIRAFGILKSTTDDVAWSIADDYSSNNAKISAIAYTSDGGVTWTAYDPLSLPGVVNLGISYVYPTNVTTAYVAGYKRSFGNGGIFKTTDAGANWVRSSSNSMYSNSASFCNLVYFYDENNGFSQGDPINGEFEMYYTTDAGATWTPIDGSNIDDPLSGEYGYTFGIAFTPNSSTVWFTTNKGRLFRSTDQGHTWTAFQTPITDFGGENDGGSVTFKDDNEGWIYRRNGELYHSLDGGATWTQMSPTDLYVKGYDISFIPGSANTLVVTGDNGGNANAGTLDYGTQISYDGGQTWTKIINYKFGSDPWMQFNSNQRIFHISLGFRDLDFGLSGGLSHINDPNDSNSGPTQGVFKFKKDVPGGGIASETIAGLSVYPNPASSFVTVNTDGATLKNIAVYDISGKEVINFNNLSVNNMTINTSDLEKGIYLMKIEDANNNHQAVKLVIK